MEISSEVYGKAPSGEDVEQYTLQNKKGTVVKIITYGAIVTAIEYKNRKGKIEDVTLGFDALERYVQPHPYFGATVGRFANRIAKGTFTIDARVFTLATNNGANALHGGTKGLDKVVWKAEPIELRNSVGVKLGYISLAGDEGYPGNLKVNVIYSLDNDNKLTIEYAATTDRPTPVNLTHHTYFNLSGAASGKSILNHQLKMPASRYLPVDAGQIPTGERRSVAGTPMDFSRTNMIGARMGGVEGGYDHYWILDRKDSELELAATLFDPESGRGLHLYTTEPGLQFYTGNFLDGVIGRGAVKYDKNFGLCLEPTGYPDAPNQKSFPSTILMPGHIYRQTSVFKFFVD